MNTNKAVGSDRIPARMLKDAGEENAPSITYLVNKSIMGEFQYCVRLHVLSLYMKLMINRKLKIIS